MKEIREKETTPLSFGEGHIRQVLAINDVTDRLGSHRPPREHMASTCCIPGAQDKNVTGSPQGTPEWECCLVSKGGPHPQGLRESLGEERLSQAKP